MCRLSNWKSHLSQWTSGMISSQTSLRYTLRPLVQSKIFTRRSSLITVFTDMLSRSLVSARIDYSELHPVAFHVEEFLGVFTECTGAYTNFKTECYYDNVECGTTTVETEAAELGICYKLVDIGFCGQVHPDP